MQEVALTLELILRRAHQLGAEVSIVTHDRDGERVACTWRDVAAGARRGIAALDGMGMPRGARVATFAHNGREQLELFYGVPCGGRVLLALNSRHTPDALHYACGETEPALIFVSASLTPQFAELRLPTPEYGYVVIEDGGTRHPDFEGAISYWELVAAAEEVEFDALPEIDEWSAASICYTSGTSGPPKGVVYSHRSTVLHSLGALTFDSHGIRAGDVVLPLTPMFHANGWGLPFTCGLAPAALVFAADTSPESVAAIVARERVNVLAGVPTFLVNLEPQLEQPDRPLASLERIICGGAKPAPRVVDHYVASGMAFMLGWGMTELSPCGTAEWTPANGPPTTGSVGKPVAGVELRIKSPDGPVLPPDGEAVGELQVRGPWVAGSYLGKDDGDAFEDGWLRTGDLASIRPDGTLVLVDRLKDLIKSGGEWISSQDLERAIGTHAAIQEVAVVPVSHPRWDERPAAIVTLAAGDTDFDPEELRAFVRAGLDRWQVPDALVVVDELARTSVGKVDKRELRARHGATLQDLVDAGPVETPDIADLRSSDRG
ncbi:MAG: AMP-binding protein [Actinobacteria bacterium]|nr:AMP-binding protein [Actinomycetota bacterium]